MLEVINAVCAEGMMATQRFEPTPAWLHALAEPDCPCHLLLVAEDAGRVVGWCRAFPGPGDESAEVGLGLLPGYRGLGYGKQLVSRTIAWATDRGLRYLRLSTRPDNERAIGLFRKFGFDFTAEWLGPERVMIRSL